MASAEAPDAPPGADTVSPWQDLHARLENTLQRLRNGQAGEGRSSPLREPLLGAREVLPDRRSDDAFAWRQDAPCTNSARLSTGSAATYVSAAEAPPFPYPVSARDSLLSCESARTAMSECQQETVGNMPLASARSSSPAATAESSLEATSVEATARFPHRERLAGLVCDTSKPVHESVERALSPPRPLSPSRALCCRRRNDAGEDQDASPLPSALSLGAMRRMPTPVKSVPPSPEKVLPISAGETYAVETLSASGEDSVPVKPLVREVAETAQQQPETAIVVAPEAPAVKASTNPPQKQGFAKWLGSWVFGSGYTSTEDARKGVDGDATASGMLDTVQFASSIVIAEEKKLAAFIEVRRLGSLRGKCSIEFFTCESLGQVGVQYAATAGKIVFNEGETSKTVQAAIIPDRQWAAAPEFEVYLCRPEGCSLGKHFRSCTVKVAPCKATFPAEKFADSIAEGWGTISKLNGLALFWHSCRLSFMFAPGLRLRTGLALVLDQSQSLYLYTQLLLGLYMLDVVFNTTEPWAKDHLWIHGGPVDGRVWTACLVGVVYVGPLLILTGLDQCKARNNLRGCSKLFLQNNILRRYLNLSSASLADLSTDVLEAAIFTNSDAVSAGYISLLEMVQSAGGLVAMLLFLAFFNPAAVRWYVVLVTVLLAVVGIRSGSLFRAKQGCMSKDSQARKNLQQTSQLYMAILQYEQSPQACQHLQDTFETSNCAANAMELQDLRTSQIVKIIAAACLASYAAMTASAVLTNAVSLGAYLVTLKIFVDVESHLLRMHQQSRVVAMALSPIKELTWFLNLPTNYDAVSKANEQRRVAAEEFRSTTSLTQNAQGVLAASEPKLLEDTMLIRLGANPSMITCEGVLRGVDLAAKQGSLVGVASEKTTLLAALMDAFRPHATANALVAGIPGHLRLLQVDAEPMIFDMACWDNLSLANSEAEPEDAKRLLQRMGMVKALEILNDDLTRRESGWPQAPMRARPWSTYLPASEKALLNLVRALLAKPDVLVITAPLSSFGEDAAVGSTFEVLHEFVHNVGVSASEKSKECLRTCFFLPDRMEQLEASDRVWYIDSSSATARELERSEYATADSPFRRKLSQCVATTLRMSS